MQLKRWYSTWICSGQFEINVKLIKQAEEIDKSGAKLMGLPT